MLFRFAFKKILILLRLLPLLFGADAFADRSFVPVEKGTFILDYKVLQASKDQVKANNKAYVQALNQLKKAAARPLAIKEYYSVMQKSQTAVSGDKHDYLSLGTYWWPDPAKPDGLPYIRKDGETNPEIHTIPDAQNLKQLTEDVHLLALCYYFTEEETYAKQAIKMIQVWFLNPATKMNPHLDYSQVLKGHNNGNGRSTGIVDSEKLVDVVDAVQLLRRSPHWRKHDLAALQQWFTTFCNWLTNSDKGKEMARENNNIASLYELQLISYALFAGQTEQAQQRIRQHVIPRIGTQFTEAGEQPKELVRTKPWTYSVKNLNAWLRLGAIAQTVGIDLYNLEVNNRSVKRVLQGMLNYALQPETWPHPEKIHGKAEVPYITNTIRTASAVWPDLRDKTWAFLKPTHNAYVAGNSYQLLLQPYGFLA